MAPEVFAVMIPTGLIVRGDRFAAGEGGIVESRYSGITKQLQLTFFTGIATISDQ